MSTAEDCRNVEDGRNVEDHVRTPYSTYMYVDSPNPNS